MVDREVGGYGQYRWIDPARVIVPDHLYTMQFEDDCTTLCYNMTDCEYYGIYQSETENCFINPEITLV